MEEQELRQLFSTNIKKYRIRHNWSQTQLAKKICVTTNFLSDIENCKKWVSPFTLIKLAQAMEVNVYELFKPENTAAEEQKDIIMRLTADMSKSLASIREHYLRE